jgi:hypothetical protein
VFITADDLEGRDRIIRGRERRPDVFNAKVSLGPSLKVRERVAAVAPDGDEGAAAGGA